MNYSRQDSGITFPISSQDQQCALKFAKQQVTSEKKHQIYRNVLAVLITQHYLEMIGVPSELENSYIWNPIARFSSDTADLYIPETKGRLECRVVEEEEPFCFVPEETWEGRIGYVAVKLNKERTEGTVLGFIPQVSVESVPLSYLRSLDDLIDCISKQTKVPINLGYLLDNTFPTGWQTIGEVLRVNRSSEWAVRSSTRFRGKTPEELVEIIQTTQNEPDRWYAVEMLLQIDPDNELCTQWQAADLSTKLAGHSISLVVAVLPKRDGSRAVLLRAYPIKPQSHLPIGLKIRLLDDADTLQGETDGASPQSQGLQFVFSADVGDCFSVQVTHGEAVMTESFIA